MNNPAGQGETGLSAGCAVIRLPAARLGPALRAALAGQLTALSSHAGVRTIVLAANAAGFPAGAGLAELEQIAQRGAEAGPTLAELCRQIERSAVPVVAALRGRVVGGGLELALAAHGRVAAPDVCCALPATDLGLVPAAGGTQRLPRLVGADTALRLMLGGEVLSARAALETGLIDAIDADPEAAARRLAQRLASIPLIAASDRRDGLGDGIASHRAVAAVRAARASPPEIHADAARQRIIDCVEAAQLLPFDQGAALEAAAFHELLRGPQSVGLRHAAAAAARAARFAEARGGASPPAPRRLGIFGADGAGMVLLALQVGLEVVLIEPDRARLVGALEKIAALQQAAVTAGRLSPARRAADWSRLISGEQPAALAGCAVVLVPAPADLPAAVEATVPGTALAVLGRGGGVGPGLPLPGPRVADGLGLHAGGGRLAEIAVYPGTASGQVLLLAALARRIGLQVLRIRGDQAAETSLAERVMGAGRAAAEVLAAQGVAQGALASALRGFGLGVLVPAAWQGTTVTARDEAQILARTLGAMANTCARLVGEGLVECPAEVDFALVTGGGFPRWQGGPMAWADRHGLLLLRRDLEAWGPEAPDLWTCAPLLSQLAARGGHFRDMDALPG